MKASSIFSVLIFASTSVVISADHLRGGGKLVQSRRYLQSSGSSAGCKNLVTVAVFRSDIPTEIYLDFGNDGSNGAVGASRDHERRNDWSFEWILNSLPCPHNLGNANSGDECYVISNVNGQRRIDMNTRFAQLSSVPALSEVKPTQFWKIVRDGPGNKITISNADHGRVVLPSSSGSGRQIRYGGVGYALDDRFWNLQEKLFCELPSGPVHSEPIVSAPSGANYLQVGTNKKCPFQHPDRLFKIDNVANVDACYNACRDRDGCTVFSVGMHHGNLNCMGCKTTETMEYHGGYTVYELNL